MKHRISFERTDSENIINYLISINKCEFKVTEFECIEIIVSFIRAFSDIEFIINKRREVLESTKWIDLTVMKKEAYGLKVELSQPYVKLSILKMHSLELSLEEFEKMVNDMYNFLNEVYGKEIIDFRIFSPSYLEHMLGVDLPYIEKIEYDRCSILNLECYNRIEPKRAHINEHELFMQLQSGDLYTRNNRATNHLFESNEERLRTVLTWASNKEYLKSPFCAVVYGNEKVVRDGTHRIACLYYLYGNIEVPIIRIHFSKVYYSYSMYQAQQNNIYKEIIR